MFSAVTDWAYLPVDAEVRLSGPGSEVALPAAVATRRFDPVMVGAIDIAIEIRGAGASTRQVTNFMSPEAFDGADKLMCVELLTPSGNWSSYPPHRHDADCPVNNEEIYYFRVGRDGTTSYEPDGFGLHRTYTVDGDVDLDLHVADGDVFLVHCRIPRPMRRGAGLPGSTTSTSWPAPATSGRWRSATTRRTTGSASRGSACQPTRGVR